jgi:amino acid transporter
MTDIIEAIAIVILVVALIPTLRWFAAKLKFPADSTIVEVVVLVIVALLLLWLAGHFPGRL